MPQPVHIAIEIDATFSSPFQKEVGLKNLKSVMEMAIRASADARRERHRKVLDYRVIVDGVLEIVSVGQPGVSTNSKTATLTHG